jgi:hypothetical protein
MAQLRAGGDATQPARTRRPESPASPGAGGPHRSRSHVPARWLARSTSALPCPAACSPSTRTRALLPIPAGPWMTSTPPVPAQSSDRSFKVRQLRATLQQSCCRRARAPCHAESVGPKHPVPDPETSSSDPMPPHQHRHHTLNRHATSKSHRFSAVAQILAEKGTVMHPYLNYVYVTMVREERERQAEHQRLVALARRLRRQHRRIKTPHASIGVLRRRRTPALQPGQPEIASELRPGRRCMGASPRAAGYLP